MSINHKPNRHLIRRELPINHQRLCNLILPGFYSTKHDRRPKTDRNESGKTKSWKRNAQRIDVFVLFVQRFADEAGVGPGQFHGAQGSAQRRRVKQPNMSRECKAMGLG